MWAVTIHYYKYEDTWLSQSRYFSSKDKALSFLGSIKAVRDGKHDDVFHLAIFMENYIKLTEVVIDDMTEFKLWD